MKTSKEEIAQWVIDNRYPKSELNKMDSHELYHGLIDKITEYAQAYHEYKTRWVEIGEKTPDVGHDADFPHTSKMILVSDYEEGFVGYGQYENHPEFGEVFIDADGNDFSNENIHITHWQPLPAPPKINAE